MIKSICKLESKRDGWDWVRSPIAIACVTVISVAILVRSIQAQTTESPNSLLRQSPSSKPSKPTTQTRGPSAIVTLDIKDRTIQFAIDEIVRQARLHAVYDQQSSIFQQRRSLKLQNVSVASALMALLKGTKLEAKFASDGQTVMIRSVGDTIARPSQETGETGHLVGELIDSATGRGIPGATISIVGTSKTVTTSDRGQFVLRAIPLGEQTVTAKLFGYRVVSRSVAIQAGRESSIRLVSASIPTTLSGVVTTATGQQRKIEVGNDIASIQVEDVLRNNPVSTVSELLATRVPGLYAAPMSGQPGAPQRIRIRGVSSLNASNDPIIIVDGVQVHQENRRNYENGDGRGRNSVGVDFPLSPLDQIDVNSIEKIDVLKGPSAVALYGSDAANGVIVVTTKRGKPGPVRMNASTNWSTEALPGKWPDNYYAWGTSTLTQGIRPCFHQDQYYGYCTVDSTMKYQILNNRQTTVFGRGHQQDYSIGFTGGVREITYSFTISTGQQTGLMRIPKADVAILREGGIRLPAGQLHPQGLDQKNGTAVVTMGVGLNTDVTISTGIGRKAVRSTPLSNAMGDAGSLLPAKIGFNPDGSQAIVASELLASIPNFRERQVTREDSYRSVLQVSSRAIPTVNTALIVGLDSRVSQENSSLRNGECFQVLICGFAGGGSDSAYVKSRNGIGSKLDANLRVSGKQIGFRWLSFVPHAGLNITRSRFHDASLVAKGMPKGAVGSFGAVTITGSESEGEQATTGAYGEIRVNVADRFWMPFSVRTDAASSLGGDVSPTFPRISLSYLLSDQPSFSHVPLLGRVAEFRIRTAYGAAGRQPPLGAKYRTYKQSSDGGEIFYLNSIGNTELRPERSQEFEVGFDTDILEAPSGRVSLSLTWANKQTRDLIIEEKLPRSLGGYALWTNLGNVQNTALDVVLETSLSHRVLTWRSSVNFSRSRNKLVSLAPTRRQIGSGVVGSPILDFLRPEIVHRVGYPLYGQWARQLVGFSDQNTDGLIAPGEVTYSDSLTYIGAPYPRFTANAHQQFDLFSKISVSAVFSYENGVTQFMNYGRYPRVNADPSLSLQEQAVGLYSVMARVQTVTSLRWTSIQVNYIVPNNLTQRVLGRHSATLALFGTNVGLWSNYRGKDPNVGAGIVQESLADNGQLPQPRRFGLSLKVN